MKVLIIGSQGQLGSALKISLASFNPISLNKEQLSLGNSILLKKIFEKERPKIVINCAAYTNVDLAEKEKVAAENLNHLWVKDLVACCNQHDSTLIHFSTDYVFDGAKMKPYTEHDPTNPLNIYGKTKLAGDQYIASSALKFFIFRVSWLYSYTHKSFFQTMLKLQPNQKSFNVVDDQWGRPTSASHLADFLNDFLSNDFKKENNYGLYNFSANGPKITWYGFAKYIFYQSYSMGYIKEQPEVLKLNTYSTVAERPKYSVLSNKNLEKNFNFLIDDWRVSVKNEIVSYYQRRA